MPLLLLFAPCQKLILSQDNEVSLIGLMHQVQVPVPVGIELPPDIVFPVKWDLVTIWHRTEEDASTQYFQRTELILPDGRATLQADFAFSMTDDIQRNISNITGLPVGQPGLCILRLLVREGDAAWQLILEYPLVISHVPVEALPEVVDPGMIITPAKPPRRRTAPQARTKK